MIHIDEHGERGHSTILLLHGAGAVDGFAGQYALSERYHLVVPHLYGAGESAGIIYEPQAMLRELDEVLERLAPEQILVVGHSLGAQLAFMLICRRPEHFCGAMLLSPWLNASAKAVRFYCSMAGIVAASSKWSGLERFQGKYWGYTEDQANYLAQYAKKLTAEGIRAFYRHAPKLEDFPQYGGLTLPMLAVCGSGEVGEVKRSLELLKEGNPHCEAVVLPKAGHDYPMRKPEQCTSLITEFIEKHDLWSKRRI